jgi:hypothetical protein
MRFEIRLYIEGGGDHHRTRRPFVTGFHTFFKELRDMAAARGGMVTVTMCGGRTQTCDDYKIATQTHPESLNFLLVDAEGPVQGSSPWEHLRTELGKKLFESAKLVDKHCHLMVEAMEAWLVADRETLKEYYGQGFSENALPRHNNVEKIAKDALASGLENATRLTRKGRYHKTHHGPQILERIRPSVVRKKAPGCDRLFTTLETEINNA